MKAPVDNNALTSGSLLKGLVALASPMLASSLLQSVQMLIDLFWVGRLGSDSVAALAMSGTILMTLFPVIMGMSTGTVALVSRFSGAGRYDEAADAAGQTLLLAILLGIASGLVGGFFAKDFLSWLGARDEVAHLGAQYLQIYFMGSTALYILVMGSSIFQGAGNTTVPMFAMILATLLNMVLDPVLIYGLAGFPRMGVRGAATAAVISQGIAAVFVLGLLSKGSHVIRVHPGRWRLGAMAWKVLAIGLPSSGQLLARSLMGLALMSIVARSGTAAVAAYGIGLRFHMMILIPAFSIGNALATLVGQNLGARRPDRAQAATWLAVSIGLGIVVVSIALLMIFAPWLIARFDKSPEVIRIGAMYLWLVSPVHLFATLAIIVGRALQGAGATLAPMVITLVALWGLQVPLAVVLSRVVHPSVVGIWWAINIATLVHGLMLASWFRRGHWKKVEL